MKSKTKTLYFYTFEAPYIVGETKLDYWKASSVEEVMNEAFKLYKTFEFHIEQTLKREGIKYRSVKA